MVKIVEDFNKNCQSYVPYKIFGPPNAGGGSAPCVYFFFHFFFHKTPRKIVLPCLALKSDNIPYSQVIF